MTILITGATGTVGRTATRRLVTDGVPVRAVSRRGSEAGLPTDDVVSDYAAGLHGVSAVFVHPRAVGLHVSDLVSPAVDAGVRRLVVMSAVNVDEPLDRQPSRLRGDRNAEVEAAVTGSGLDVVVLRCDVFASNVRGTIAPQLRFGDVVRAAFPAAAERMVDERDIGEVVAAALVSDDLVGKTLELTGPQALTMPERVEAVAEVTGRPLTFEEITPDVAARGMVAAGLPPEFATLYLDLARERGDVRLPISPDVDTVLGHRPRPFVEWVRDNREVFA